MLGAITVLVLFALLGYAGMRVARRSADPFVRLAAGAATVWLCGQAVINTGYVTSLLPVTGIPLPFISAGGTSLLASFFVLGMLVSFARHEAPAVTAARRDERRGRRSRLQRWLRIPVPQPYRPPKRRPVGAAASTPPRRSGLAPAPLRRGTPLAAGTSRRATAQQLRARPPGRVAPSAPCRRRRAPLPAPTGGGGPMNWSAATPPRLVVAGGHSAGHIEPAMNFADALRRLDPTVEITALGTERGLDTTLIPARGYPLELIPPVPLSRKLDARSARHAGQAAVRGARGRRGPRPDPGGGGGRFRRLRRHARLPRGPKPAHPVRRPRGERAAGSRQPGGRPADPARLHRLGVGSPGARDAGRHPASSRDRAPGPGGAAGNGSRRGSGWNRTGRCCW